MKEKNFKFREKYAALVGKMTDKQAGEFIKAVCGYVFEGKPMESKDEYLKGVFVFVQNALDTEVRDRENGKIGGAIVAEKYKERRGKVTTDDGPVSETNVVSQLIIVAADAQGAAQSDKGKPYKKNGRPKNFNAYGGGKYPNENKDDRKAV
ncbi:MAG: hypothetical protein K2L88_06120 [Clostridiales bacterium]|nr:hypothetical protein [Clostridiales bacterium]